MSLLLGGRWLGAGAIGRRALVVHVGVRGLYIGTLQPLLCAIK
jgi:hypothetical protein